VVKGGSPDIGRFSASMHAKGILFSRPRTASGSRPGSGVPAISEAQRVAFLIARAKAKPSASIHWHRHPDSGMALEDVGDALWLPERGLYYGDRRS
jgi:hypothetical protein